MPPKAAPFCIDSRQPFDPDRILQRYGDQHIPEVSENPLQSLYFMKCVVDLFDLSETDKYAYQAMGSTTLRQTQMAINGKRKNGLHDWYLDEEGKAIEPPPLADCEAYTQIFSPTVSLPKALNAFKSQSKSGSLRAQISAHLSSRYNNTLPGLLASRPKPDRKHINPYYDLWAYSCEELEWAGPWPDTVNTKTSHHILPIFYHHFGCVVPSYAALSAIAKLAQPNKPSKESVRPILDVGSGCGYWTYMLRKLPLDPGMKELDVVAIDNEASVYRTMWIGDTVRQSGTDFLKSMNGGEGCVLLLVYPQATGDFTAPILKAFKGDVVVVAGTQNGNGFTGFTDQVVDEWVEKNVKEFELGLRMPLPTFAGKDEALFVFQRKKAAV